MVLVLRLPQSTFKYGLSVTRAQAHVRLIHPTIAVLKRKRQAASSSQTLHNEPGYEFSSDPLPEEEELFGSNAEAPQTSVTSIANATIHGAKTPELLRMRSELLQAQLLSTLDILRRPGKMRQPPRKSTVARLTALSETSEDIGKVLEVIAAWRSAGLPHEPMTCDEFIGRCVRLKCPEIALKVFQDRPKYGMDVPSLVSARRLLHALALPRTGEGDSSRTLFDCLTFAELYPLYGLPVASKDVVSCAILAKVIAQHVPKRQTDAQEGRDALVSSESWREILTEFEAVVKGWQGVVGATSPRVLRWFRGSIDDVHIAMLRKEGKTADWIQQFTTEIRALAAEKSSSVTPST